LATIAVRNSLRRAVPDGRRPATVRHHLPERGLHMVLLEFSMAPLEKGESVGSYVARSLEIIERSGLDYRLHAMGTILEGELDQKSTRLNSSHVKISYAV